MAKKKARDPERNIQMII